MAITTYIENNTSRTIDSNGNISPYLDSKAYVTDGENTVSHIAVYTDGNIDWGLTQKLAMYEYERLHGQEKTRSEYHIANADKLVRDDVYMNDSLVRVDYSISTPEGSALVDELETTWPNFISDYRRSNKNLVSQFSPMRLPYQNDSISYYDMQKPPQELINYFNIPDIEYLPFYGLKFDKTNLDVHIKTMLFPNEMNNLNLDLAKAINKTIPVIGGQFYGVMYNLEGTISPLVDVYFTASYEVVSQWCNKTGLNMPYTDDTLNSKLSYWGAVYNSDFDKITHLKAYITHYLEEE